MYFKKGRAEINLFIFVYAFPLTSKFPAIKSGELYFVSRGKIKNGN